MRFLVEETSLEKSTSLGPMAQLKMTSWFFKVFNFLVELATMIGKKRSGPKLLGLHQLQYL